MKETKLFYEILDKYLQNELKITKKYFEFKSVLKDEECVSCNEYKPLDEFIIDELDENNFQKTLFQLLDSKNIADSEVYNKAFLDRRLFSKIRNDKKYHPSKNTVIALGLALELDIINFEKLLKSASYFLAKNNYFDLIIRFFVENKRYDIFEINEQLIRYNCLTLL